MPNTPLPDAKEKAVEISRKIANSRPSQRDKAAPENQVSGGFNQKSRPDAPLSDETSASEGDGQ